MSCNNNYTDNRPYNIESPQELYVQWSHGNIPSSYFENGKWPSGNEPEWVWENTFIPTSHYTNGILLLGHSYRREKIGFKGVWTLPIPLFSLITEAKMEAV